MHTRPEEGPAPTLKLVAPPTSLLPITGAPAALPPPALLHDRALGPRRVQDLVAANQVHPNLAQVTLHHQLETDHSLYPDADTSARLAAAIIDVTLVSGLLRLVELPFSEGLWLSQVLSDERLWLVQSFLMAVAYCLFMLLPLIRDGQTIGKWALGIRVVGYNFDPRLGLTSLVFRETLGKVLALLQLLLFFSLTGRDGPGIHDKLFGTRVIAYRSLRKKP